MLPEGQRYPTLHRQLEEFVGERRCGFSSYNLLTRAAMMNNSDLLGLTPESMFALVAKNLAFTSDSFSTSAGPAY